MPHLKGGKITGSHTTLTEAAKEIVGFLEELSCVSKIALGIISNRAGKSNHAGHSVKITDKQGCILATITQKCSVQEVWIYAKDRQEVKLELARFVRNNAWDLRFGKSS